MCSRRSVWTTTATSGSWASGRARARTRWSRWRCSRVSSGAAWTPGGRGCSSSTGPRRCARRSARSSGAPASCSAAGTTRCAMSPAICPKELHDQARAVLRAAWKLGAKDGKARIEQFASWVEKQHPDAAGSLREGLGELFTVSEIGLTPALRRCLGTTNVIDNAHSGMRHRNLQLRLGQLRKRTGFPEGWRQGEVCPAASTGGFSGRLGPGSPGTGQSCPGFGDSEGCEGLGTGSRTALGGILYCQIHHRVLALWEVWVITPTCPIRPFPVQRGGPALTAPCTAGTRSRYFA